jgi:hypothetical protein
VPYAPDVTMMLPTSNAVCCVLCRQVSCCAWRPLLSSMLAVGVEGGVALWSLTPSPLAGGSSSSSSSAGGSSSGGVSPGWVTFLPYKEGVRWVSAKHDRRLDLNLASRPEFM